MTIRTALNFWPENNFRCKVRFCLYILPLLFCFSKSYAREQQTVAELRGYCVAAENVVNNNQIEKEFDVAFCLGYMAGMNAVLQMNCYDKEYYGSFAAQQSSIGQAIRAFINWSDEHPELWNEPAWTAMIALSQKLPCQK